MAFIRVKKVKGLDYYFLVKSQWDPDRKGSKQKIIKYLGKASNVTINDIPPEYRNNPSILSTLAANQEVQNEKSLINIESDGTDGEILDTLNPFSNKTDSMTLHPKLCISPSGVHIKILSFLRCCSL
jgi:hypothetical protein